MVETTASSIVESTHGNGDVVVWVVFEGLDEVAVEQRGLHNHHVAVLAQVSGHGAHGVGRGADGVLVSATVALEGRVCRR